MKYFSVQLGNGSFRVVRAESYREDSRVVDFDSAGCTVVSLPAGFVLSITEVDQEKEAGAASAERRKMRSPLDK